ncbi:MAG: DUF3089 domain-containing protein [Myxococcales bacterium]|nr:DUF3089 domain-containing protein [Myxococcales bacterium]
MPERTEFRVAIGVLVLALGLGLFACDSDDTGGTDMDDLREATVAGEGGDAADAPGTDERRDQEGGAEHSGKGESAEEASEANPGDGPEDGRDDGAGDAQGASEPDASGDDEGGSATSSEEAGEDVAGRGAEAAERAHDGRNPDAVNPYPDYQSEIYTDDGMWLCKPGIAPNYCIEDIADATEALPDGSFRPFMDDLAVDHPIDCLFWYPTVERFEDPTSLDFDNLAPMLGSIRSQAARFSRVCNVYAPLYRQVSLNNGGDRALGYADVVDGFKHYIANLSEGRNFVIYGHSQGTGHATRLLQDEIDGNDDLRKRLVSAVLIGGGLTADTFDNIPLCTAPDQTGCAVGYQAYGPNMSLSGVRAGLACTNPGALGGGKVMMRGAYFLSRGAKYSDDLGEDFTATWGLFRDFFSGECVEAPSGGQVLRIDYTEDPDDVREHFLDLDTVIGFGLHVFDYQFPLDDLLDLVASQREAKLAEGP